MRWLPLAAPVLAFLLLFAHWNIASPCERHGMRLVIE
jgi:hypothetical protein